MFAPPDLPCVCTPTSSGTMPRSTTRKFRVPYTLRLVSTTPPLSRGSIDVLPQVSSICAPN